MAAFDGAEYRRLSRYPLTATHGNRGALFTHYTLVAATTLEQRGAWLDPEASARLSEIVNEGVYELAETQARAEDLQRAEKNLHQWISLLVQQSRMESKEVNATLVLPDLAIMRAKRFCPLWPWC